jgi:hypothetical protein
MAVEIDWSLPWFEPWRNPGEAIADRIDAGAPLHDALNAQAGAPLRFVPQGELPADMAYESFVRVQGLCPVREGLHDFFNGLCWLKFPQAKRQLNRLQAGEIARHGIAGRRGPVRDAITVFDENGAVLDATPALWDALLARDWRRLFVDLRPQWADARLIVFGHALLEKLAESPRKDLTAHVWRSPLVLDPIAELDAALARGFDAEALAAKPFTPLPVLGVPGWWSGNENFSFYDDSLVFRPRRTPSATTT